VHRGAAHVGRHCQGYNIGGHWNDGHCADLWQLLHGLRYEDGGRATSVRHGVRRRSRATGWQTVQGHGRRHDQVAFR
jgi:hypothetical protein